MFRLRPEAGGDSKAGQGTQRKSKRVRRQSRGKTQRAGESTLTQVDGCRHLQITIFASTPSPNSWVFSHWRKYHDIKSRWFTLTYEAAIQHIQFGKPIQLCEVEIHRQGVRELDHDNLIGGMKPLIDGMVKLGFLADDTPDVIQNPHYHQTRVPTKDEERTVITLREIDGRAGEQQDSSGGETRR